MKKINFGLPGALFMQKAIKVSQEFDEAMRRLSRVERAKAVRLARISKYSLVEAAEVVARSVPFEPLCKKDCDDCVFQCEAAPGHEEIIKQCRDRETSVKGAETS